MTSRRTIAQPLRILTLAIASLCSIAAAAQTSAPSTAAPATRPMQASPAAPARPAARPGAPGRGPADGGMATLFNAWDRDHSGSLTLAEFKQGWQDQRRVALVARLGEMFQTADANHDKLLQPAEYSRLPLMKRAGADAPPMATFDIDHSNSLDYQEYMRMVDALVQVAEAQGGP